MRTLFVVVFWVVAFAAAVGIALLFGAAIRDTMRLPA